MKAVYFNPNFPCLKYALDRIGYPTPEKIPTLNQFLNHPDFNRSFCTDFSKCLRGDILTWVDSARVRDYTTDISQEGEVSHTSILASFHCAVVEDDTTISHLVMSGGTMYSIDVEELSRYLKRGTRADFPALVSRWEGYNG